MAGKAKVPPKKNPPGAIVASLHYPYQNIRIAVPGTGTALEVLADTGQFVVTAGYAKINTVDVPQRKGIAVFAGFDPVTATLPIILDTLGSDLVTEHGEQAGEKAHIVVGGKGFAVEEGCQLLEWMAGQGRGPGGAYRSAAEEGTEPPRVIVETLDGQEHPTKLVPLNYNSAGQINPTPEWLITGIQWGDSIRSGSFPFQRRRQKVTLTLTEYKEPPTISASVAASKIEWKKHKVGRGRSKSKAGESPYELVRFVANWPGNVAPGLAQKLLARWDKKHKGRQKIPHTNSKFPPGTEVEVPYKKK